jgi:hypothetical protein
VLPDVALVFSLTAAAQATLAVRVPESLLDMDAYQVYAAIIPDEWPVAVAKAKRLVVTNTTITPPSCPSDSPLETECNDVVSDFERQNATIWRLRELFPLDLPYDVVAHEEIMATFAGSYAASGWESFYREHPDSGGYISMSAVGFNASRTRAMFYLAHSCGDLCGGGTYHFLRKVDGVWRESSLKTSHCTWVS